MSYQLIYGINNKLILDDFFGLPKTSIGGCKSSKRDRTSSKLYLLDERDRPIHH